MKNYVSGFTRVLMVTIMAIIMTSVMTSCITDPKEEKYAFEAQNYTSDPTSWTMTTRDGKESFAFDVSALRDNKSGKSELYVHNCDYEVKIYLNTRDHTLVCDQWIHIDGTRDNASLDGITADAIGAWYGNGLAVQSSAQPADSIATSDAPHDLYLLSIKPVTHNRIKPISASTKVM